MTIKNLRHLFNKKREESMQERAERSRKTDDLEAVSNETTRNLIKLLNEVSGKKVK